MQLDWLANKPQNPLTPSAGITGKWVLGIQFKSPRLGGKYFHRLKSSSQALTCHRKNVYPQFIPKF